MKAKEVKKTVKPVKKVSKVTQAKAVREVEKIIDKKKPVTTKFELLDKVLLVMVAILFIALLVVKFKNS